MGFTMSPHLNPTTPMAYLPPNEAFEITTARYIAVGSCSVLIWEILHNLRNDYKLLTEFNIRLPTVIYFFSRLACLQYSLVTVLYDTAAITHNCAQFQTVLSISFALAIPPTSLLFFLRIRAIFNRNPFIVAFYATLWLAVLGASLTPLFGTSGMNIGPTKYCIVSRIEVYVATAAIVPLVFDTFVFAAITWRLMGNSLIDYSLRTGLKAMVFGEYLPAFSRALLQDGQSYYLTITVFTSLTSVIMLYVPNVPPAYRVMFASPNISVMNIMACRVFRNTKFGLYREVQISTTGMKLTQERRRAPITFRKPSFVDSMDSSNYPHFRSHNVRFSSPDSPVSSVVEEEV